MDEIKNEDLRGTPSKDSLYYGSNVLGFEIKREIRARVKELGNGWTVSKLFLECYREQMLAEGFKTIVPPQNP